MSARIYGANAVGELLAHAPEAIAVLYVRRDSEQSADVDALVDRARACSVRVHALSAEEMRTRAGSRGGTVIAAEVRIAQAPDVTDFSADSTPLLVLLDGVTDPHNLGAILRSASAFAADAVIVAKRNSAPLNDAAVRASAGAAAYTPLIRVTNLARTVRQLRDQGIWTIATTVGAPMTIWDCDLTLPTAIIIGAEGKGIRPGVVKACDLQAGLALPSPIGSLNASVFAGAALAIAARARQTDR